MSQIMPRLVDHDVRKAELLQASLALVAAEGIGAATMRRLARAADCTTGAVTYYFEGRDALLVAMLRHAHQRTAARMVSALSAADSPRARLLSVLREALPLDEERLAEWRVWLAFWGAAAGNLALLEEHAARYDEWRTLLTTLVSEVVPSPGDAARFVDLLVALVDGYGLQIALCRSLRSKRAQALRQIAERALEGQLDSFGTGAQPPMDS